MRLYTHTHTVIPTKNKTRDSNFELLRIICMILIIMHHYALYSEFNFSTDITINKITVQILTIGGKIGVNVFILITGYFMVNGKFKVKKVINLILQVFTYTFIFLIINCSFNNEMSIKQIIKSILPVIYSHYWFITSYIVLYIISPYINKLINNMNKKEFATIIIILVTIKSLTKTFLAAKIDESNLVWFVTLYLIGAYINKYHKKHAYSLKIDFIGTVLTYIIIILSVIVLEYISTKISFFRGKELFFSSMTSTLVLINAIFLFLSFKNINIEKNRTINIISSTVLGIYIIHENIFMRDIIWKNIFKGGEFQNSPYLILNAVISIGSVFIVASLIEWTRQKTLGKVQDKFADFIIRKSKKIYNKYK